ncbi:MAG: hypothetical protein ACOCPT_04285 [Halanaeroarchaeum sp.]
MPYEFDGDERDTTIVYVDGLVPDRPIFEITNKSSAVPPGERGAVRFTITNNGSATQVRLG